MRFLFVLVIFICLSSCEYFTKKEVDPTQRLDSINYRSVDISPSFSVCDSLYKKEEKEMCFRTTIHQEITKYLSSKEIKVKGEVDENIIVKIIVSNSGHISVGSITATEKLRKETPSIEQFLLESINALPKVAPAVKRGIPVTSEYVLPIRVQLKN